MAIQGLIAGVTSFESADASGIFAFYWAQNFSNAAPTTVFAGSYLQWAIV